MDILQSTDGHRQTPQGVLSVLFYMIYDHEMQGYLPLIRGREVL